MAVEWEPNAFDSCEDIGLSVLRVVRGSGEPDGAVVKRGIASACDTPPVPSVAPVPGVNSVGGEDVAVMSSLGAAAGKVTAERKPSAQEMSVNVFKCLKKTGRTTTVITL